MCSYGAVIVRVGFGVAVVEAAAVVVVRAVQHGVDRLRLVLDGWKEKEAKPICQIDSKGMN